MDNGYKITSNWNRYDCLFYEKSIPFQKKLCKRLSLLYNVRVPNSPIQILFKKIYLSALVKRYCLPQ
jgi:hypothetical protein